jgi:23S rRNA G2445 N2-methylase RlmL
MPDLDHSPEQAAREAGLREVSEVLLNIEQAIKRAERAERTTRMTVGCDDLARMLSTAARNLEAARKDLFQGAYFSADSPKLF